ncbi:lipid droplet-associated hydrolase-like protein [Leptotrombidium deliense]|uniref:Lipid droplet-associated hydrolase n=1 Tax=Leptotrombidium deliense TaxID=299467 RepID=A0A443SRE0_9ACAR|nr:lipid droplet-associated hydrolase-like protein [Leptotrombidium deliense]
MDENVFNGFKELFLEVNQVETHVIQYGLSDVLSRIPDSKNSKKSVLSKHKDVILFIPGNPGTVEFYKYFLELLHTKLKIPVIGVSHAGHVSIPQCFQTTKRMLFLKYNYLDYFLFAFIAQEDCRSVNSQILHKLLFIENYIPKNVNLILIGHSLGAYIILEMLKTIGDGRNVTRNVLVFPVIERLYNLTRAKVFAVLFALLYFPILILVFFLNFFTEKWKQRIVKFVIENIYKMDNYPECILHAGLNSFNTTVIKNVIALFYSEINQIRELQDSNIAGHINTVSLMYGGIDPWCPRSYYEEIRKRFPTADITLPFEIIPHAFVANRKSTDFVANAVCQNIKKTVK